MTLLSRSEKHMIEGIKNKDEKSFHIFYNKNYNFLYYVVLKIVKNREDTEEIVQDTFIKIYEKISSFDGNNFKGWIYTIAKNLAINYFNRTIKKRQDIITDSDLVNNQALPDYSISPIYAKLLDHFSEETTEIIIYRAVFDFSFEHISELKNLSKSYVFRTYKSSLPKLKLIMGDKIWKN